MYSIFVRSNREQWSYVVKTTNVKFIALLYFNYLSKRYDVVEVYCKNKLIKRT